MNLKLLITGASGNLGSKILASMHELGNECAILLRTSSVIREEMARFRNLTIFRCSSEFEIAGCIKVFNPDLIIHTACNYGLNGESDFEISQANINFGWNIIQALDLSNSLKTFININTALPREVSVYARSKHLFSDICLDFSKKFPGKLKFIDVVTQSIYDESTQRSNFISYLIKECLKDGNHIRLTAGQQKRDFIHADDVVSAIKTIALNLKNIQGEQQFELGSGSSVRVMDVVLLIHKLSSSNANLIFGALPYRNHEPMELVANITKLNALGWAPSIKLENKLEEIIFKIKNAKTFT